MNTKLPPLSSQMLAVLRLLDCESLTARQINDRLYSPASRQSRKSFAASMSRTTRRMAQRRLIDRNGGTMSIAQSRRLRIHPEMVQATIDSLGEAMRQAVAQAFADYERSQKSNTEVRNDAAADGPVPADE
jgi:hypothetical protein